MALWSAHGTKFSFGSASQLAHLVTAGVLTDSRLVALARRSFRAANLARLRNVAKR